MSLATHSMLGFECMANQIGLWHNFVLLSFVSFLTQKKKKKFRNNMTGTLPPDIYSDLSTAGMLFDIHFISFFTFIFLTEFF